MSGLFLLGVALAAEPVWIDVDTSVGLRQRDVDDGVALIQAFSSDKVEVKGVSAVFGNAALVETVPRTQEIVRRFGPAGLQTFSGASEPSLDPTPASIAIAEALAREPMTLLALGPVTNIAAALHQHPELVSRVKTVVAVAGRRTNQHFFTGAGATPHRDFNFEKDPDAFASLIASGVSITLAPWELSSSVWIDSDALVEWSEGNRATRYLAERADSWLALWKDRFKVDGFNPFDTLAVGWVIDPAGFKCERMRVRISRAADDVHPKQTKPYLVVDAMREGAPSVRYCYGPPDQFSGALSRALLSWR